MTPPPTSLRSATSPCGGGKGFFDKLLGGCCILQQSLSICESILNFSPGGLALCFGDAIMKPYQKMRSVYPCKSCSL